MIQRITKIKKVRIHREGTNTLFISLVLIVLIAILIWYKADSEVLFWLFLAFFGVLWGITLNFYRCPKRYFEGETDGIVVAPADGKIVVLEEIDEKEYFNKRMFMVSVFMSPLNVHANWIPVDGTIISVKHFKGNYHKAWLPKASEENEHADIVIEAKNGERILCRQIAGAMARRIVTYSHAGEKCFIDEHMGFIKLGSRVDIFLPINSEICVKMNQKVTGDYTVIAKLDNNDGKAS